MAPCGHWLLCWLAQILQNISINTEQRVTLNSTVTKTQDLRILWVTGPDSASQACAGLFPGSILLKVDYIAGVCTPRPERWLRGDCVYRSEEGRVDVCLHAPTSLSHGMEQGVRREGAFWGPRGQRPALPVLCGELGSESETLHPNLAFRLLWWYISQSRRIECLLQNCSFP